MRNEIKNNYGVDEVDDAWFMWKAASEHQLFNRGK